jgi:hypothetical protein
VPPKKTNQTKKEKRKKKSLALDIFVSSLKLMGRFSLPHPIMSPVL